MPIQVSVICVQCGYKDEAMWSDYGSEQPCLNCDAPNVDLVKVEV